MKRRILLSFFALLAIHTVGATGLMDKLGWMYGMYEQDLGLVKIYESWHAIDPNHWTGNGNAMNQKGDTIFREQLNLIQENDTIWYIATVANQNGGQPVRFRAVTITDSIAVFSNPKHDFPRRITYMRAPNGLNVTIEGLNRRGKSRTEEFEFTHLRK